MPAVQSRFRPFVVAALYLLAIVLLPLLFRPLFHAVGFSVGVGDLRSVVVAVIVFVVLRPSLVRAQVAKRSFQMSTSFEQDALTTAAPVFFGSLEGHLRPGIWLFIAAFASFVAFLLIAYTLNDAYLLWEMDGKRFEFLVRQQHFWFPFYFGYTNDFLHSLGNIWYPLNMKLDPGFLLATDPESGVLDRRLSYLIFSVELYLSTFLLSTVLRQGLVVSLVAAWTVVLLAMPLHGLPAIYPVLAMAPNYPISQTIVLLSMFRLIGRSNHALSGLLAAASILLMAHTALAHPTAVILMTPILAIFAASILVASDTRREVTVKLACVAIGAGIVAFLGFPSYLIGMFQYSAPYYFSSELFNDRAFFYFISVAFQNNAAGLTLFLLAMLGAALTVRHGGRFERRFAIGLLSTMAVLAGAGALTVTYYQSWRGPSPIYFEFFVWPIYAIFAAATFRLIYNSGCVVLGHVTRMYSKARLNAAHVFHLTVGLLLCVPWALLAFLNPHFAHTHSSFGIAETQIVSLLKKEVGLRPGSFFRGRVATLTGQDVGGPVNWHDLNALDGEFLSRSGNSHRSLGLWFYGIPTLFELSSLITPPFFLITREFLERPGDLQMRNAIVLRRYNPRILRALGVRFVVTDAPLNGDATLRITQEMPKSAKHYLYELDGANLGNYSPTKVEAIADVGQMIAALGNPAFDFKHAVVLEKPLQVRLVPANSSQIQAEPGYLHLKATSEGTSLLVLPFEFSNCLTLEATGGGESGARVVRANLLQTGILFERRLDASLTFFTGPFRNSGCRIQDKRDMDNLGIRRFRREIALPPSRFPGLH
jgi:hypothetical protein